jgi:hypothetical protein
MRPRVVFGVRIDPKIGKEFTEAVTQKGLSTCLVVEALLTAWTVGIKSCSASDVNPGKTIIVNQSFPRVVKRERRSSGVTELIPEANCYVTPPGAWIYRRPANKSDLNPKNGHHVSCVCNVCQPFRGRALSSR